MPSLPKALLIFPVCGSSVKSFSRILTITSRGLLSLSPGQYEGRARTSRHNRFIVGQVERPFFLARRSVQRHHSAERRGDKHRVIDHDRREFFRRAWCRIGGSAKTACRGGRAGAGIVTLPAYPVLLRLGLKQLVIRLGTPAGRMS